MGDLRDCDFGTFESQQQTSQARIDADAARQLLAIAEQFVEAWLRLDEQRLDDILQSIGKTETAASWIANRKLNVVDLALGLAPRGLSEGQFRRLFGLAGSTETPGEMVNRLKMTVAAELLCSRTLTISAISRQMQIADIRNFSRRFRAFYGVRPRAYRHANAPPCNRTTTAVETTPKTT